MSPQIVWYHLDRETSRHSEIETFAEYQVFVPFPVRTIVCDGTFDLDDDEIAIAVNRHHINPPSVRQLEFGQRAETQVLEQAAHAAGH